MTLYVVVIKVNLFVVRSGPYFFKKWAFRYKIVDLSLWGEVLPNLPNPPGYGPVIPNTETI